MIFEIIMNNPDRGQYMSKSKDAVLVRLIDHVLPGGPVLQKLIPELLHRTHPPPGQHRFTSGSAPDPSAVAFTALAAAAATVSRGAYTPSLLIPRQ